MAQVMSAADYANTPAGAPPFGVVSNFDNPPSRAYEAHVYTGICIGTTTVFLVLRLYVKATITHIWGLEDCKSLWFGLGLIRIKNCRYLYYRLRNTRRSPTWRENGAALTLDPVRGQVGVDILRLGSVTAKPESLSSLPELFPPIVTIVSFSLFAFLLNIYQG